jgi:hypothetical protein
VHQIGVLQQPTPFAMETADTTRHPHDLSRWYPLIGPRCMLPMNVEHEPPPYAHLCLEGHQICMLLTKTNPDSADPLSELMRIPPMPWKMSLLGMQARGMAPKPPSITPRINLQPNQGDTGLKTSDDGTSDITKHDELHIH